MTRPTLLSGRPDPVWRGLACLGILASAAWSYEAVTDVPEDFAMPEPLPLEESVASLRTRPGLRVELVAAEPLVMDPIAFDWGPDGRLWVVEMADYPLGIDEKGTPGGRVRWLEDSDGDGRYDRSTVFLQGLNYPTSVKAWGEGVLVIACPEIFYAEDRNGDGTADHREVLYRGFREGNQQHRVNGLEWDLDGWLVVANGDSGGTIESVKTGETLELGSFDLRIHPESGGMALLTGRTQYGRVRDDFGEWFGNNNSRPFFHFSLEQQVLQRNPHAIFPPGARDLDGGPPDRRVYPLSREAHRFNDPHAENRITSACGLAVYRDRRLGEASYGNLFICEPVHNLVHRRALEPEGVSFRAVRAPGEEDSEFLASSDYWFRPVWARTGPEGGLWVADMHRYVIEHPEWIPEVWQAVLDLRAGHERGRIYRVVPEDCQEAAVPEDLTGLAPADLAARLGLENGALRDRAHQLLLERANQDPAVGRAVQGALREVITASPWPAARIQASAAAVALNAWHGPDFFNPGAYADDPHPEVRRWWLGSGSFSYLSLQAQSGTLAEFARSADARLARDIAVALGSQDLPGGGAVLAELALSHSGDPVFLAAAMSSLVPHLHAVAAAAAEAPAEQAAPLLPYLFETAMGTGDHAYAAILLDARPEDLDARFHAYAAFLGVADRRRLNLADLREPADGPLASALEQAAGLSSAARVLARDADASPRERAAALALLGREAAGSEDDAALLLELLAPALPSAVQSAAARRLLQVGALLPSLDRWETLAPATRGALLSGALRDRGQTGELLAALEEGRLPVAALDAATREQLFLYPHAELRQRAKALLGAAAHPDRAAVLAAFAPALELPGDPGRGRGHFQALCLACHKLGEEGRELGPDLAALSDKAPASLLAAILDPNRAVEDKYMLYQIELSGGEALAGAIAAESGDSLTVQLLDGARRDLLRSEIASLQATGRSAMPEGLEAALDHQAMADLIALLRAM